MDTSIDTLAIEIESTGKEASGGIDSLISKLEALKVKVNENLKAIGRLNSALIQLKANSGGIGNVSNIGTISPQNPTVATPQMQNVDTSNAVQGLQDVSNEAKNVSVNISETANAFDKFGGVANNTGNRLKSALQKGISVFQKLKSVASGVTGIFGKIGSVASTIASPFISFFNILRGNGQSSINSMGEAVNSLSRKLRMTTLALLGTRGAFTAIRKAVSEYMAYDTALAQTLQRNWAILGALIAPILERIIGLFSTLIAYIATFVKMLTGVDLVARANKKSLGGVGSSAGTTAKKVKELSNELGNLQKFDDLNVVDFPDNSGSSGGGGGGGAGGAGGIEPLTLPEIDTSPIDKLWEYIKADRWYALGMDIAHAFNNAIRTIDFDYLTEKAREWATNFADFFNGLRDGLDGQLLGKQLAGALNTAFTFVNTFFEVYNWSRLGKKLGDIFNAMVDNISWEDIGKKLGNRLMALFETLYTFLDTFNFENFGSGIARGLTAWVERVDWGKAIANVGKGFAGIIKAIDGFVTELDWSKLATTISDYIKNGLNGISKALQEVDWLKFGDDLYKGISDFITNIDWGGLTSSLSELLGIMLASAFQFLVTTVGQLVFNVVTSIFSYFGKYIGKQNWGDIGTDIIMGILEGIWNIIKNIGVWIYDNILKPFVEGVKKAFGIASPSKVMMEIGGFLIEGFLNGIKGIWDKVKSVFTGLKDKIGETFTNIKNGISEKASSAVSKIKDTFNWNNIKNTFETMKTNIGNKINDIKNNIGNKFSEAWTNAKNAISESKVGQHFTSIKNKLKNTFSDIGTQVGNAIGDKFSGVINAVTGFASKIINGFIKSINKVINIINEIPGVKLKTIAEVNIPKLATGTNKIEREGLYHLHQGEAVVPKKYNPAINNKVYSENNDKMLRKMDDLLNLLNNMETTNNVYIGNEKVHKSTVRYINREQNIYGTTVV